MRSMAWAKTFATGSMVMRASLAPSFSGMVLLDTIPEKEGAKEARITMLPVAKVFAQAIERIYADKPVSPLFS